MPGWMILNREVRRVPFDFDAPINKTWAPRLDDPEHPIPDGPGWQMWQFVSEGGPVSPVFETRDELAAWLADNHTVAQYAYSPEEWDRVIDGDTIAFEIGTGKLV
jgi:hypothetical protein